MQQGLTRRIEGRVKYEIEVIDRKPITLYDVQLHLLLKHCAVILLHVLRREAFCCSLYVILLPIHYIPLQFSPPLNIVIGFAQSRFRLSNDIGILHGNTPMDKDASACVTRLCLEPVDPRAIIKTNFGAVIIYSCHPRFFVDEYTLEHG